VAGALDHVSDAELITAVRAGEMSAFGVLYERHLMAAIRAAGHLVSVPAEREDLVSEAFTRILRLLREGRGPDQDLRPYLLVTMRNIAITSTRRTWPYAEVPEMDPVAPADEPVLDRWRAEAAADAFASLPERWRTVLWHTEVQEEKPAHLAPVLGLRPNGVSALAYRAREGLRQAYLRQQVPDPPPGPCRSMVAKLAGYVRHNIPVPLSKKIAHHLRGCPGCRARADALSWLNTELRVLILIVLTALLFAARLPHTAPAAPGDAFARHAERPGSMIS
jgi:RNA polymerase sigma factor (sigma-70 family)